MKIVCISDTHMQTVKIPECDLLIHAGDLTNNGNEHQVREALKIMSLYRAQRIILVPGNHDFLFQKKPALAKDMCDDFGVHLLLDSETVVNGYKVYGSPWQPWFMNWAFNAPQDAIEGSEFLQEKWDAISDDTDILVTHCPPYAIGGVTEDGQDIGCRRLAARIVELAPRLHIFGHCHHGYGVYPDTKTLYVNASSCNEQYHAVNAPILIHI